MQRLEELTFPPNQKILALAPHPDDFDAIGVTMKFLKNKGHRIFLGVVTTGANGVEDGWKGLYGPHEKAAIRETEQLASCNFFGLPPENVCFLRLEEESVAKNEISVSEYLRSINPNFVFLPHGNDTNRTHRRIYETFVRIVQQESLQVCAFLNLDAKTISMRRDVFTFFDEEQADWKAQLLRFHCSQQDRNLSTRGVGFDERVLNLNREVAQYMNDLPYAEVFEIQTFGCGHSFADVHAFKM